MMGIWLVSELEEICRTGRKKEDMVICKGLALHKPALAQ